MQRATDLVEHLRETFDSEELRYAFRELAKEFLDRKGENELTICDNDGVVLGYFIPALQRLRRESEESSPAADCMDQEAFLRGSESAREVIERTLDKS